jgi:Fe-S oxidoreductase
LTPSQIKLRGQQMKSGNKEGEEKLFFAPGCALMLYKPGLAEKILQFLDENLNGVDMLLTCCQHDPKLPENSKVINVCPGCDKRYGKDYKGVSTISLWEVINENNFFVYPDYKGRKMSIIDACPTREMTIIHNSIRELLLKMNISLVEPRNTRKESTCCGDVYYGAMPTVKVKELMIEKAVEMPADDIVVHCVSCIMAVCNGDKNPKYLADLLFNEQTSPESIDLDEWHTRLTGFIENH